MIFLYSLICKNRFGALCNLCQILQPAVGLRYRRRLYSNFLQFSDNFGLATLVWLAGGPGVNGGVRRAVRPSVESQCDATVGATQDGVRSCDCVCY